MIPILHFFKSKKRLFIWIKSCFFGFSSDQPSELNLSKWFIDFLFDFIVRSFDFLALRAVYRFDDIQLFFFKNFLKVK